MVSVCLFVVVLHMYRVHTFVGMILSYANVLCAVSILIGFDCGVFTCMFADFVTNDCEPVFNQTHITQCRQRIALSIMKNCAIE